MARFLENIIDLLKSFIVLILVIYLLSALIAAFEIGKAISQFIQSIGFGAIIAAAIIILFILLREEF